VLDPADVGLPRSDVMPLRGGDPTTSATIATAVLRGEPGPRRDGVLLYAAAALEVSGNAGSLAEGLSMAAAAIDSGAATDALSRWVTASGNG
jgi:anthranilate phosphoribosyltransferase